MRAVLPAAVEAAPTAEDPERATPRPADRLAEGVVERVRRGLREHERARSSRRLPAVPGPIQGPGG